MKEQVNTTTSCFHCGDEINAEPIIYNNHFFCCAGCKSVYKILEENNLCNYYSLEPGKGISIKHEINSIKFDYLDDEEIKRQLIDFSNSQITKITFHIPTMHCISCVWLLEHLYKLNKGVLNSRVDFLKKQLNVTFNHNEISLKELVTLLAEIGYEPAINLNAATEKKNKKNSNRFSYQLGVAGFCFGNIMLISFPEYLGLDEFSKNYLSPLFGYLNLALALPVFFYSAQDYFISAYKSLKAKIINIDFPLALGILVMFVRSTYEVVSHTGIGFFDTLAGLVFLLLVGKWAQQYTINKYSFERDYKSYFPIAITTINTDNTKTTKPVNKLSIGDRILVHHNEIIPADSILLKGEAQVDFSFVTGESTPVKKVLGEIVYAGGRQTGSTIELEVSKTVSQSYLTQLWNSNQYKKAEENIFKSFQSKVSKYFTIILLAIAISSAIFWLVFDPSKLFPAFTAVLIIACPCALAISSPFALGNAMRMLGRSRFYIKTAQVVEQMAHINSIVFDKTGTITQPSAGKIFFEGNELSTQEKEIIYAVTSHSVHPLSKKISSYLQANKNDLLVENYNEISGKGISATVRDNIVKIGSKKYLQINNENTTSELYSDVYVSINNYITGRFIISHNYRSNLKHVISRLKTFAEVNLLSGDNESEKVALEPVFDKNMHFNQSPADKMLFIDELKNKGKKVAMIGDGLNDAGALKVADIGISITENTAHFTPGSDVIMAAEEFDKLPNFFNYGKKTLHVIKASFVMSLIYNVVGLTIAVQGTLSPLFAAILMPISSISVIVFTTGATYLLAKQCKII